MKKYFYTDRTNNFGPFTPDELEGKNLRRDTLVWYEGLNEWVAAGTLPELSALFGPQPPVVPKAVPDNKTECTCCSCGTMPGNGSGCACCGCRMMPGNGESAGTCGERMPKTWLTEAILVTLFCCLPFGIAGIVYSARVEACYNAGDIQGARHASDDARKWTTVSLITGILCWIAAVTILLMLL